MQLGNPEGGKDAIPDLGVDRASMRLQHRPCGLEVLCEHLAEGLRLEALPQTCRPLHIAEQYSDGLAELSHTDLGDRCSTSMAEPRFDGDLNSAVWTNRHRLTDEADR